MIPRWLAPIFVLLIVCNCVLFVYSLWERMPHVDDAWLGEHAYWQARLGYVKSNLMAGITQQEVRHICHHKLLTLQGARVIEQVGFSLPALKSISLVYLLLFYGSFALYLYQKRTPRLGIWLAFWLLTTHTLLFEYAFVFRPELPIMTLGFWSFWALETAARRRAAPQTVLGYWLCSGALAGAAIATHLNAVVIALAGAWVLLWQREWRGFFIYGIGCVALASIYFYDFTPTYNFSYWVYQISESPSVERVSGLPFGLSNLVDFFNEHMRFFHSPPEISFSILLLLLLFGKFLAKRQTILVQYTLCLVVMLALVAVHKTPKYSLVYLPYLVLLMSNGLMRLLTASSEKLPLYYRGLVGVATVAYFGIHTFFNITKAIPKFSAHDNAAIARTWQLSAPQQTRIIAPMTFIFNEINHFGAIEGELCFSEMQKLQPSLRGTAFLAEAQRRGISYIYLTQHYKEKLGVDTLSAAALQAAGWTMVRQQPDQWIVKAQKDGYH